MLRQFELIERVKAYDPHINEDLLNRAYIYAMKAHGPQKRESGVPYFSHPVEVAGILTHWHLDSVTIATALLHDTVEDTTVTLEDIRSNFGEEVASLVDGVTKLANVNFQSEHQKQAENFRKFVLAMSKDLRVLLVKLADRVHNMRTLKHVKSAEKRQRVARETMEIYAPLAERIGMHGIRTELEDLSFAELQPDTYASVLRRLEHLRETGEDIVIQIIEQLHSTLLKGGVESHISGREKSPYSIWRKMQDKNSAFDQLPDIMAFRVLVKNVTDCYQALGIVHSVYTIVSGRFKDYISFAKDNGYQALHTTVIGPLNQRLEIQIRTFDMHETAEMGLAAHWGYKDKFPARTFFNNEHVEAPKEGSQYRWVRELLGILEHTPKTEDLLQSTKLEMFTDHVFCFTPTGELIPLPKDSTPIDFAYAVHSAIGDKCIGARVNSKVVPLHTILKNGDKVEIITSKENAPSPIWKRFAVTEKARAHIRRFIYSEKKYKHVELGKDLFINLLKKAHIPFEEEKILPLAHKFHYKTLESFFTAIGQKQLLPKDIIPAIEQLFPPIPSRPQSLPDPNQPQSLKQLLEETKQEKKRISEKKMEEENSTTKKVTIL